MDRLHKTLVLLLVAAVPAGAPYYLASPVAACFTSGSVTYRISPNARAPDYRVRIDNSAASPTLRLRLADRAESADFVLVDDFGRAPVNPCQVAGVIKTIKIVSDEPAEFTVSLSRDANADQALYVHSARFSHADGAALFAVLQYTASQNEIVGPPR